IPIREALRQLEAEGYVNYTPNKGATVVTALPVAELLQVLEIREGLESRLMQHAIGAVTREVLARARAALDQLNAGGTVEELRGKHEHFHSILFSAAERPRMAATINQWRFRYDNRSDDEGWKMREFARSTK